MEETCKITFWQGSPSQHQSAYIRALADISGVGKVRAVFMRELNEWRRAMGWRCPDFGAVEVSFAPEDEIIRDFLTECLPGSVYVMSELIAEPRIRQILTSAKERGMTIGLFSEGRDWRSIRGLLRRLHSYAIEKRYGHKFDFVLAVGHLSRKWYLDTGIAPQRIFDFCYVVEKPENDLGEAHTRTPSESLQILYVGQLIRRKRLDLLISALSELMGESWNLKIIGDGEEKTRLMSQVETLGLTSKVQLVGATANATVRKAIAQADVLVLPSHWDGWGAVVNEALMAGTRVICSDFCGAAELVRDTPYGNVFNCDSLESLKCELIAQIRRGPVSATERAEIRQYAETITGPVVAQYLKDIIDHVAGRNAKRPIPPWRRWLNDRAGLH